MAEEENNFVRFKDFNINNLHISDNVTNDIDTYNYRTRNLYYKYSDGKERVLRLRTPVLFTLGLYEGNINPSDTYMPFLVYREIDDPTDGEIMFRQVLVSITDFLKREAPKKLRLKKEEIDKLNIFKDNIFFSRVDNYTNYYEKIAESLVKIEDTSYLKRMKCRVIAYIDFTDVYITQSSVNVGSSISEVIIIEDNVRRNRRKVTSSKVEIYSDDEL